MLHLHLATEAVLGTIITAFPERCRKESYEPANRTLLEYVTESLDQMRPQSIEHCLALIALQCINYVDFPLKAGLRETLFHIFSSSVAKVVSDNDRLSLLCLHLILSSQMKLRIVTMNFSYPLIRKPTAPLTSTCKKRHSCSKRSEIFVTKLAWLNLCFIARRLCTRASNLGMIV